MVIIMADIMDEIRTALKAEKIMFGEERVIKSLKKKELSKVVLSKNVADSVKEDIERYASIADIPLEQVNMHNEDLGVFCKRKHFVSVIGLI